MTAITAAARRERRAVILDHLSQCPGLTARQLGQLTGLGHQSVMRDLRKLAADSKITAGTGEPVPRARQVPHAWYPGSAAPTLITPEDCHRTEEYVRLSRSRPAAQDRGTLSGGAACAGSDPALFFPENGDDTAAKAICGRCPVRASCLADATARGEQYGVWGGENFAGRGGVRKRTATRTANAAVPVPLPRNMPAMDKAAAVRELRTAHRTLKQTARAAGMTLDTVRFYLDLLEASPVTQDLIRDGVVSPTAVVQSVRRARARKRAS
jgi:hypothetical protein